MRQFDLMVTISVCVSESKVMNSTIPEIGERTVYCASGCIPMGSPSATWAPERACTPAVASTRTLMRFTSTPQRPIPSRPSLSMPIGLTTGAAAIAHPVKKVARSRKVAPHFAKMRLFISKNLLFVHFVLPECGHFAKLQRSRHFSRSKSCLPPFKWAFAIQRPHSIHRAFQIC